jgi:large subunit ribosomal protein L24
MRIQKGDTVKVLYGKYAGKTGAVTLVIPKKQQVVVEGLNKVKRHLKGNGKDKASAIVEISKPMPISKVQLVDDSGKATRVKYEIKDGKKSRVSVRSGKVLSSNKVVAKAETKEETKKPETKKTTKKTEAKEAKSKKAVSKKSTDESAKITKDKKDKK